jgi:hypothetical protein
MPGEALGLAALGRDDVNVGISRVFGAKGDPFAIGGEVRIGSLALEAGEASRRATK